MTESPDDAQADKDGRTVFCKKYQKDLPGLDRAPFPGPKGQEIFESVSKQAWEEWQAHQTMLINEKHLNMMDTSARIFLAEERDKFIANEEVEQAEGYVPVNSDKSDKPDEKAPNDKK